MDKDIDRLRETLRSALKYVLDAQGARAQHLSIRKVDARFYGIHVEWETKRWAFGAEARELIAEISADSPSASVTFPDVKDPLAKAEGALQMILSAIEDVELDEPASVLWEQERDQVADLLTRIENGHADQARCSICGAAFFDRPDHLREHFESLHRCPPPEEKRLIAIAEQRAAIERASGEFRNAYESIIACLAATELPNNATDHVHPVRGKPPHPWRDILLEKARERKRKDCVADSNLMEADVLLEWATSIGLPLESSSEPPARRTVANWLASKWP